MIALTQTIWTSSLLILTVIILRAVLGTHIPARLRYALWLLPALRLCVPISIQQALHLMPRSRLSVIDLPYTAGMHAPAPMHPLLENLQTGHVFTFDDPTPVQAAASIDWQLVLLLIWIAGALAVAVWYGITNRHFSKALTQNQEYFGISPAKLPVYTVQGLRSPCLYLRHGKPCIYIPKASADNPVQLRHILAHEDMHFRHYDHLWAMVRIGLLTLYWFHPLVWVMAFLSRRDCEQACDEAAIHALGEEERLSYGRTLVGLMAAGRPSDLLRHATTMTDSKSGVRQRVQRIAKKTQTRAAAVFLLIVSAGLIAVFTFTGSTTHQKACAALRQTPPVSGYCLANPLDMETRTMLSEDTIHQFVTLFLQIQNTKENPEMRAENTAEWQLDFTLPDGTDGKRQHLSMEMTGTDYMLVYFEQGGRTSSYFVHEPDAVPALRGLVGLPPVQSEPVPNEPDASRLRAPDPSRLLSQVLHYGQLSSQFPIYVQLRADSAPFAVLFGSTWDSFVESYEDQMQFLDEIMVPPSEVPSLTIRYSDKNSRMHLYEQESFCMIEQDNLWGCYSIPADFQNALLKLAETEGTPYISFSDAEIQAAEQAARDYFANEASTRTLTALWYDDGWCQFMRHSYLQNGRGAVHDVSPENVLVLLCDFTVEGDSHTSWSLIFIRDSEDGPWRLDDQGY